MKRIKRPKGAAFGVRTAHLLMQVRAGRRQRRYGCGAD
ncbi:hypothetical protein RBY4I_2536 [Rhodobacterales bacterium Y4I]|nr:hypothetical protein RBY4I_2536 [Rhodobacterales bacterium Y4I]